MPSEIPENNETMRNPWLSETEAIQKRVERAALFGVNMTVAVHNDPENNDPRFTNPVVLVGEDQPVFAASINKLLIAACKLDTPASDLTEEEELLLIDMLRDSDNDATIGLKGSIQGGDAAINGFAASVLGLSKTELHVRGDGSSHLGFTTARESLQVLYHLLYGPRGPHPAILEALEDSTTQYGVRNVYRVDGGVTLLNKTGDFYGEDDEEVGYAVHHDVGLVYPHKPDYAPIIYSITTKSPNRKRAFLANQFVAGVGAEIMTMTGGKPYGKFGRLANSMFFGHKDK